LEKKRGGGRGVELNWQREGEWGKKMFTIPLHRGKKGTVSLIYCKGLEGKGQGKEKRKGQK